MVKNVIINIILYYIIDNNYYCIFSIRMFCSWSAGGATAKPRKGFINRYCRHEVVFTNVFKAEGKLTCSQIRAVVFSLRCCGCSQSADVCVLVVRCRTTVCLLLLVFLYFCHRSRQCLSFGVFTVFGLQSVGSFSIGPNMSPLVKRFVTVDNVSLQMFLSRGTPAVLPVLCTFRKL